MTDAMLLLVTVGMICGLLALAGFLGDVICTRLMK